MTAYLDTSALAKYFHTESGSASVVEIIDNPDNIIWISELAITEFLSAIHRKYRMGEVSTEILQKVADAFEIKVTGWNIEPVSTLQTEEASKIIKEYGKSAGIRTLDALHLAAYNLLRQDDWTFVLADKQLNNVVREAGINCMFIQ